LRDEIPVRAHSVTWRGRPFAPRADIAYFSMEIAIAPEIHTYAGGLGVLAGDTARSCADLELPVVFVTLASRLGYLDQSFDPSGRQVDAADPWDPARFATPLGAKVSVLVGGREIWVQAWHYPLVGGTGFEVPILLLDTNLPENAEPDRAVTDRLYGGDDRYRLTQEVVLGVGGFRLLRALGFEIRRYHLNEGHSALLTLELVRRYSSEDGHNGETIVDLPQIRERCIFTTHTPVEAGHDRFGYDLAGELLGSLVDMATLKQIAGAAELNLTRLALETSGYVNGVAKRHAEVSNRMFPEYYVHSITNGIHAPSWAAPAIARLFDTCIPGWRHEPEQLAHADEIGDAPLWAAHQEAKQALIASVEQTAGIRFDPDIPLIGFARRVTGYKRPDLLFSDLDRLRALHRDRPFQVVLAGKSHPKDTHGLELVQWLQRTVRELAPSVGIAFLPNYGLAAARLLVAGCDVWLNTPLPPLEASGTSGMKAALNGVLNLGVLDGWWIEACVEGRTGWGLGADTVPGSDADALYRRLGETVLPLYTADRARWLWMMKQAISKIGAQFNSHRMMRRYASEAYLR
jgi:glycogen phosphorylase